MEAVKDQNASPSVTETSTASSKKQVEKVAAGDDVIKYAETHDVTTTEAPKEKSAKKEPKARTIKGFHRGTGKEVEVNLANVSSISRYIYVHNIFDQTPVIEAIVYKAIMPGTAYVTMDITEELFEELRVDKGFKGKVHYNYVDGMSRNNPKNNSFFHQTFSVKYPEWIKPEDVTKQAQEIVSHYGVPDLSGIEKVLWPNFDGKVQKASLAGPEAQQETEQQEVSEA